MKISDAVFEDFWGLTGPASYAARHQWGATEKQAIREYAECIEEAIAEDRRENGPRVQRLQESLAVLLLADIARVRREDAAVNRQGIGSVALTQRSYRDGIVCAMQMRSMTAVPA